jgi:uncharacterized damage-inducible protein DinB
MRQTFVMFAGYNAWANERLYEATSRLSDADYRADQGAFFKSMHGTLNHILVADRIWMHRFTGEGALPQSLDAILYEEFEPLREARRVEDERIVAYVRGLTDADVASDIHYGTISQPAKFVQPLSSALSHVFNHQTHHRGQAHCLLTKVAGEAPSLDLILYQRQTGIGLDRTATSG